MTRLNSSSEVIKGLTVGGLIVDTASGVSTTIKTGFPVTAGDQTIEVTSATGLANDDYVRVDTGDNLEVVHIESIAADVLTLYTPVLRDHVVGVAAVEQNKVDLGAISDDGVTHEVSEDKNEINASTQAGVYANLSQTIRQALRWNLLNFSIENAAVAFGIPETQIYTGAGTEADPPSLGILADLMNTLINASVYFKGTRLDLKTLEMIGFNVEFDVNKTINWLRGRASVIPFGGNINGVNWLGPYT